MILINKHLTRTLGSYDPLFLLLEDLGVTACPTAKVDLIYFDVAGFQNVLIHG